jgi:methylated-DNA-[protein]-cysteine S-methyltransferase
MTTPTLYYTLYAWQPTDLILVASRNGLCRIEFARQVDEIKFLADFSLKYHISKDEQPFSDVRAQLDRYFAGDKVSWQIPLDFLSGTDFQRLVWSYLLNIPYGQTVTYGQIAKELGKPGASRAVGAANGANPIPIIIPCHRVLAGAGKLGGYGGGLDVKQALLSLEGVLL